MTVSEVLKNLTTRKREAADSARNSADRFQKDFMSQVANDSAGKEIDKAIVEMYLEHFPNPEAIWDKAVLHHKRSMERARLQTDIDAVDTEHEAIAAEIRALSLSLRENGTAGGSAPLQSAKILAATSLERKRATNSATEKDFALFRDSQRAIEDAEDQLSLLTQRKNILNGQRYRLQTQLDAAPELPAPSLPNSIQSSFASV